MSSNYVWWTGAKNFKPKLTVKLDGKILKRDTDYSVSQNLLYLGDDIESSSILDADTVTSINKTGWYGVEIAGKGSYTGSTMKIFGVVKVSVSVKTQKYSGKALKPIPSVSVQYPDGETISLISLNEINQIIAEEKADGLDPEFDASDASYKITYSNNTKVGTAKMTITGINTHACESNVVTKTFKITKGTNPMKVKAVAKNISKTKVKKANQTFSALKFTKKAAGKLSFKNNSSKKVKKYFTVNKKNGKITAKKGTPKGKYSVKIAITAKGNSNYKSASKNATVKVTVK